MFTGGKLVQQRNSQEWGKIERIFDIHPYPENGVVNLVFTDMMALSLATADPEDTNLDYKTSAQVPIIWHLTNTSIRNQGRWMEQVVMETCQTAKPQKIRVVWIPMNCYSLDTVYATEILEVADLLIKIKIVGRTNGVSVRAAVAKSWMPKDVANQQRALEINRLNLALSVLSFYWF